LGLLEHFLIGSILHLRESYSFYRILVSFLLDFDAALVEATRLYWIFYKQFAVAILPGMAVHIAALDIFILHLPTSPNHR